MAPPIARNSGSAALEAVSVAGLLLAFVLTLSTAGYLLFARAWISYQGEQSLYCLAEGRRATECRRQLEARVLAFTPWGEIKSHLKGGTDKWTVEVEWTWNGFKIRTHRALGLRAIAKNRVLRW